MLSIAYIFIIKLSILNFFQQLNAIGNLKHTINNIVLFDIIYFNLPQPII